MGIRSVQRCRVACGVAAVLVAGIAEGSVLNFISLPGLEGRGAYSGSVTWNYLGDGAGTLLIEIENESPAVNGGYLTGIAFNVVSGVTLSLATGLPGWSGISNVAAAPFPDFDFGAGIGGGWLGGGNPANGIGVGQLRSLTFEVTGAQAILAGLSASAFFEGSSGYAFAARFRGFEDGGSDKVLASPIGGTAAVPAPSALAMAATGFLGSLVARRRRA